jgi:hypothetical protein
VPFVVTPEHEAAAAVMAAVLTVVLATAFRSGVVGTTWGEQAWMEADGHAVGEQGTSVA